MKDVNEVLRTKENELAAMKRLVYCLKFVAPYLVEEKDQPPEVIAEESKQKSGWP